MNDFLKDLSPETLTQIQEAVEAKVKEKLNLHLEAALAQQDEEYSNKLTELLEKINVDHTTKLEKVVEALDINRAAKLKVVVRKYEKVLTEDAKKFKKQLVENISDYLDAFLEDTVPTADIKEAVRNKKALIVLENLRKNLAIDTAIQKESIKDAIVDGQTQINEATSRLESITQDNVTMKKELTALKAEKLISEKTANLDEPQVKYIKKVLKGKTPEFIAENFDHTLKLFKVKNDDRLESLKEEALDDTQHADHVLYESTDDSTESSGYLTELRKYK